jgi:hypothetical protein
MANKPVFKFSVGDRVIRPNVGLVGTITRRTHHKKYQCDLYTIEWDGLTGASAFARLPEERIELANEAAQ